MATKLVMVNMKLLQEYRALLSRIYPKKCVRIYLHNDFIILHILLFHAEQSLQNVKFLRLQFLRDII